MPIIHVSPRDPAVLRKRVAEFRTLFDAFSRLEREATDLANSFHRAYNWLDKQGADFHELAEIFKSMGYGASYQAKRLHKMGLQIEENWDLACSLQKACYGADLSASPLEFGFPIDVIGTPPTDEELGGQLHVNE